MKIENYFDEIMKFLLDIIFANKDTIKNINYFYRPLKEWSVLKNNKYKIIRFLSYISPWIFFPYTLLTYGVWVIIVIVIVILTIIRVICEYLFSKVNKFKLFWKEL